MLQYLVPPEILHDMDTLSYPFGLFTMSRGPDLNSRSST
ncbi:hypothetical protein PC121_g21654 [Phytophthora cactorum]|nr:hypothetical protein PC120_g24277 [Phytophthora cactorum]KAG3044846.1 hypothetical protein PC121_g21654 [Phytophthora cactorum]